MEKGAEQRGQAGFIPEREDLLVVSSPAFSGSLHTLGTPSPTLGSGSGS